MITREQYYQAKQEAKVNLQKAKSQSKQCYFIKKDGVKVLLNTK